MRLHFMAPQFQRQRDVPDNVSPRQKRRLLQGHAYSSGPSHLLWIRIADLNGTASRVIKAAKNSKQGCLSAS
jgi:hypothetical protein